MAEETVGAVVVAAGAGVRFGGNKVFASLVDRPVLAHSIDAFEQTPAVGAIVVVLAPANLEEGRAILAARRWRKVVDLCVGGARRRDSVHAGLSRLPLTTWTIIHDGARPLVTRQMIEAGLAAARRTGAAVAAVPVKDTIKVVGADSVIEVTPDRRKLWAVQTPQVFRRDLLVAAHAASTEVDATDDAALLERRGLPVIVFPGSYDNIKITTPDDLSLAEFLLERKLRGTET